MRLAGLSLVALFLVLAGCGGGGSSPSEPPPPPATPVPLEGSWSGTVTITSPRATTCTLTLELVRDGQDYFGDWEGRCPDNTQGRGIAVVSPAFFNQVIVAGLQGQPVFGGCGWSSLATRETNRLRGDWSTPQNCQNGPVLQGRLELTKR